MAETLTKQKHGTKIEWTHIPGYKGETWNPIVGCSVVSPGCTNCYAMRFAGNRLDSNPNTPHYKGTTQPSKAGPVWTGKVARASEKTLSAPLRWKKPRAIFVNSMGDLFHENVQDSWIDQVFTVAALAPQHIFIVLTKRAERMRGYFCGPFEGDGTLARIADATIAISPTPPAGMEDVPVGPKDEQGRPEFGYRRMVSLTHWPLPNVWLGVSVEDQKRADERIPLLLETPAAVRFLSCEPLLGDLDLGSVSLSDHRNTFTNALPEEDDQVSRKINWVIAGGESGPNARPMHPDRAGALRDQCVESEVPFFFKQWGDNFPRSQWEHNPTLVLPDDCDCPDSPFGHYGEVYHSVGKKRAGNLLDGKEWNQFPGIVR